LHINPENLLNSVQINITACKTNFGLSSRNSNTK
jgi:hypothetical protein